MAESIIRRKVIVPSPVQVGVKFGRLLVISDGWEQLTPSGGRYDMVEVECDCGTKKFIRPRSLYPRGIQSCGCIQREMASVQGSYINLKHGHAGKKNRAPEYRVYHTMIQRCTNPNTNKYADYGGRGIVVCDRWRGERGYENFISDMGRRPHGGSLERIDNNGPYSPDNCKWCSATDQANNRRSNVVVEHNGRKQTVMQWAREAGLNYATFRDRLGRGWNMRDALNTPAI